MDKSPTWGGSFYGPGFLERRDDVILMEQEQARLDEEEARRKRGYRGESEENALCLCS